METEDELFDLGALRGYYMACNDILEQLTEALKSCVSVDIVIDDLVSKLEKTCSEFDDEWTEIEKQWTLDCMGDWEDRDG